jgi:hypothetical protein
MKNMTNVQRVAATIANERGNRRGVPTIVNVLDILPPKLLQEVTEEAEAILKVLGYQELQDEVARLREVRNDLLEACRVVIAFLDRLEDSADEDASVEAAISRDPTLSSLRRLVHAPLRAALEPAIAKAEGA